MIKNSKIEVSLLIGSLFYFTARLRQTDFRKKICQPNGFVRLSVLFVFNNFSNLFQCFPIFFTIW